MSSGIYKAEREPRIPRMTIEDRRRSPPKYNVVQPTGVTVLHPCFVGEDERSVREVSYSDPISPLLLIPPPHFSSKYEMDHTHFPPDSEKESLRSRKARSGPT